MSIALKDPRPAREALSVISRLSAEAFSISNAGRGDFHGPDGAGAIPDPTGGHMVDPYLTRLNTDAMKEFFTLVAMTQTSRVRLETFVGFLQDHGILPQATRFSFDQQARLQKCAFIAQIGFGLDLGYDYHLHEYGTFSSFLGADFVRIIRKKTVTNGAFIPLSFKAKRFLETVSDRKIDWLCVATVAIHEMRSCDPATLQSHVEGIAIHYDRRLIRQVLRDIEAALLSPGAHINTVG